VRHASLSSDVGRSLRIASVGLFLASFLVTFSLPALSDEPIQEIAAFSHIVDAAKDAVVLVRALTPSSRDLPTGVSTGTGCVISSVGHILTTLHTVRGAEEITITLGNREYPAFIENTLETKDVALLRLLATPTKPLPHLGVDSTYNPALLESFLIAGYPLPTQIRLYEPSVGVGQVSAVDPNMSPNTIQLDLTSVEGMSGAPIVNKMGDVVGLLRSKVSGEHIGFAVSAAEFASILPHGSGSQLLAPFNSAFGVGVTMICGVGPKALAQFRLGRNTGMRFGLGLGIGADSWFSADGTIMVRLFSLYPGGSWRLCPYVGLGGGAIRAGHGSTQTDSWWIHGAIGIQIRLYRFLFSCHTLLTRPWGEMAKSGQAVYPVVECSILLDLSF